MGIAAKSISSAEDSAPHAPKIAFDIPAQPLDAALEAFGAATGLSVLYNSRLTEGKTSRALRGDYTPQAALDALLEGSGLVARYTADRAVTLVAASPAPKASASQLQRYRGLVQEKVRASFCDDAALAAGDRRMAFRFWLDASGSVERAELLDSTGDAGFDAKVVGNLRALAVGEAPPAGLAQPFTMLVMPRSSGQSWGCAVPQSGRAASR